jgi:hypothetical protein
MVSMQDNLLLDRLGSAVLSSMASSMSSSGGSFDSHGSSTKTWQVQH